ncbi:MAG TPA: hypothetical protein VGI10_00130, partial [Polyangiaceae bacterium]
MTVRPTIPRKKLTAALAVFAGAALAGAGVASCSASSSSKAPGGGSPGQGGSGPTSGGAPGTGGAASGAAGASSGAAGASSGAAGASGANTAGSAGAGTSGSAGASSAGTGGASAGGAAGANNGGFAGANTGGATSCGTSCSNAPVGACTAPQVRISSVNLGTAINYSKDETYDIPLALAAKPSGGARLAWMTGYAHYGSSTTSQVHVSELDCNDALIGTPFTLEGHDFQDIAADDNGGVIMVTRDGAGGPDAQHCGDVNNLCSLPSDRPGCYDTYMVRYDCGGNEQWATKLTTATAAQPGYTSGGGDNLFVWWYQHHG